MPSTSKTLSLHSHAERTSHEHADIESSRNKIDPRKSFLGDTNYEALANSTSAHEAHSRMKQGFCIITTRYVRLLYHHVPNLLVIMHHKRTRWGKFTEDYPTFPRSRRCMSLTRLSDVLRGGEPEGDNDAQGKGSPVIGCNPRNPIRFTDVLAFGTSSMRLAHKREI